MRNLKRALSLALAAVMLIGMMAVGTSAASVSDFSDGAQIEHAEAAAVIAGLNIVSGYEDGSFRPDSIVTRAEMAVFISKMLHGSAIDPAMFADEKIFTDYDGWSDGWVNLAYADGVISGYGDGRFGPGDTLTVLDATTMVLKALGVEYDPANRAISVMTKASELGLFGDMVLVGSNGMTRDQVAALSFETLNYSPSGAKTYKVGNLTFDSFIEAYLANGGTVDDNLVQVNAKDSLGSKFGLTSASGADELGMPTIVYTATNPKVTITLPGADATVVIQGAPALSKAGLNGYSFVDTVGSETKYIKDGGSESTVTNYTALQAQMGTNTTTYIYTSGTSITKAVIVTNYVGKVTSVTAGKDGEADTVKIGSKSFAANGFEKGDYVLYNVGKDSDDEDVIVNAVKAQSFVGAVTRYTNAGKYTIGGTEYEISAVGITGLANVLRDNLGTDLTIWLDNNGKIVAAAPVEAAAVQSDYLYVLGNSAIQSAADYMSGAASVVEITAVNTAGEVSSYIVSKLGGSPVADVLANAWVGNLYHYETESNGTLALTDMSTASTGKSGTTINAGAVSITYNTSSTAVLNNSTTFIFMKFEGDAVGAGKYQSLTVRYGNANIGDGFAQGKSKVVVKDGVALTVFIVSEYTDASSKSGDVVYFSGKTSDKKSTTSYENGKTVTVYEYTVYDVNGAKLTMTYNTNDLVGGVYEYNTDGTLISPAITSASGTITAVAGTTIRVNNKYVNVGDVVPAFLGDDTELLVGQKVCYTAKADGITVTSLWVTEDVSDEDSLPSNGGSVSVGEYEIVNVTGNVEADVTLGANAQLNVGGDVDGSSISAGADTTVTVGGSVTSGSNVTTTGASNVTIEGDVEGSVTVATGSSLTINGVISGDVTVKGTATLEINGGISADANIIVDDLSKVTLGGDANIADGSIENAVYLDENKNITTNDMKQVGVGVPVYAPEASDSGEGSWNIQDHTVAVRWHSDNLATGQYIEQIITDGTKTFTWKQTSADSRYDYFTMFRLDGPGSGSDPTNEVWSLNNGSDFGAASKSFENGGETLHIIVRVVNSNESVAKTLVDFTMPNPLKTSE